MGVAGEQLGTLLYRRGVHDGIGRGQLVLAVQIGGQLPAGTIGLPVGLPGQPRFAIHNAWAAVGKTAAAVTGV